MSEATKNTQIAVFFDYENIVYSLRNRFEQKANFEAIIDKCKEFGRLSVAKAFADWGLPYMSPALMYALQSSGFELVFVPTGSTQSNSPRKNVADLYMAISVMDILYTRPEIETFVLLTGDRDFMLLVNHLKQKGKRVVAIGVDGSSSYYLTQAVDDFFYYSEVEEIFEYQPKRQKGRPTNIYDALQQAVQVMREKGRSPRLTNLKPVMVELMGSFDERSYTDSKGRNFQKFKDFVQEAQRRGTVRLLRRGNVIEVHLPKDVDSIKQLPPIEDIDDDAIDLELAYKLLVKAATEVAKKNKSLRVGMVRNRMKRLLTTFDATRVQNEEGDFPFTKFIGFIKAAEKAGVIDTKGSGSRMELLLVGTAGTEDKATPVDENVSIEAVVSEEKETTTLEGDEARAAVLTAMRTYKNYPTSFLSLAGFVHRHNETVGIIVDEVDARDLMTEAVKSDLLHQIVLKDGRRQYELNDSAEIIAKFLGQEDVAEVDTIEDVPENETVTVVTPTFETPYEGLIEAVKVILQGGKDPVLPRVKSTMVNLMGSFSEKAYTNEKGVNFTKFKDFVIDAEARGYIRLQIDGTINRVFLPESKQVTEAPPAADNRKEQAPVTELDPSITDEIVTEDELAEALADAVADIGILVEDKPVKNIRKTVVEKAAKPAVVVVEEEEAPRIIGGPEQRQIIIEGLNSFTSYPAPFMGILSHCRRLRKEREVTITSADLRDLLSETVRVGLIVAASNQKRRPTLYSFNDDASLAQQFITQEYATEPEAETAAVVETDSVSDAEPTVASLAEVVTETPAPVVVETVSAASDHVVQQLIVDVLGTWDGFPATFADILTVVQAAQVEKELVITDKHLRKLLSVASRKGVLTITSPRGVRPTIYIHTGDEAAIEAYLGKQASSVETVQADPTPEAVTQDNQPTVIDTSELSAVVLSTQKTSAVVATDSAETAPAEVVAEAEVVTEAEVVVEAEIVAEAEVIVEAEPEVVAPVAELSELDKAYALLVHVVTEATEAKASLKLPGIRTRMRKANPALDFTKLKNTNGKGFRGITVFVRAAEKAGHVVVTGKGTSIEVNLS